VDPAARQYTVLPPDWKQHVPKGFTEDEARAFFMGVGERIKQEESSKLPNDGVKLASEFNLRRVEWLWLGRIPFGKITMHDGDPGRGKSLTYVSLTGFITQGQRPPGDGRGPTEPQGVVIVCAEDDWQDTIGPRLIAVGADLKRVATVRLRRDPATGHVKPLSIPDDLRLLRAAVKRVDATLVVIDPIMAYLGRETNVYNDASVRQALSPLKEWAEEVGVAVLLVRHLNKNGDLKAEYRGGGSIGFTGAARSAIVSDWHPTEEGVLVLAQLKGNLTAPMPSLTYRIEGTQVEHDGVTIKTARIIWGDLIPLGAQELLRGTDARKASPAQEACWARMQELFAERSEWPADELTKLLREDGHSPATINRVRTGHDVTTHRVTDSAGKTIGWEWHAPPVDALPFEPSQADIAGATAEVELPPIYALSGWDEDDDT
jgi:hypothetical protein